VEINFPGITYKVPYGLGDILLYKSKYGDDAVDHVCEIDVLWDRGKGPHIDRMYGHHDHSISEATEYKEVLKKGEWPESHLIKHDHDLVGRAILIKDGKKVTYAIIEKLAVHIRDTKGDCYKRYFRTTSYDVDLDGEGCNSWLLLPDSCTEKVEKWIKSE
jgi:hypothetical protein